MARVGPEERRAARLALLAEPLGRLVVVVGGLVPCLVGAAVVVVLKDPDRSIPIFFGLAAVGFAVGFGGGHLLAPAALARERAWLAGLGFEMEGWFDALGVLSPRAGRMRVVLSFRGEPPPREKLALWLSAVDAQPAGGRGLAFVGPELRVGGGARGTSPTARSYHAWQRRLVRDALVVVHEAYPIARVKLRRVGP